MKNLQRRKDLLPNFRVKPEFWVVFLVELEKYGEDKPAVVTQLNDKDYNKHHCINLNNVNIGQHKNHKYSFDFLIGAMARSGPDLQTQKVRIQLDRQVL